jgi:hypothetical protein
VVAVTLVLPGLLPLPLTRVKFTALADSVSVMESGRTAFSAIGLAPEFSTCARAGDENITIASASAATAPNFIGTRI